MVDVVDPGVVKTGAYKYEDGTRYVGEWNSKGQKHGMGHLVLPDGTRYDGALIGGLCSGLGVMAFPDGANVGETEDVEDTILDEDKEDKTVQDNRTPDKNSILGKSMTQDNEEEEIIGDMDTEEDEDMAIEETTGPGNRVMQT
ncbi:hypothetical protein B5X24_HaOG207806 [Helicoverpa armigera]|nr:hypothetical protein B5X24_HaOG207806 [Helicoverpa armigera]